MDFSFKRHRADKIPQEKLLQKLENFAQSIGYIEFTRRDFASHSGHSPAAVIRTFGGWTQALQALRDHLKSKDVELQAHVRKDAHSKETLFKEMELIWTKFPCSDPVGSKQSSRFERIPSDDHDLHALGYHAERA